MEYRVINEETSEKLMEKVNELLEENWYLQGGVSVGAAGDYYTSFRVFCQALAKEDEKK